MALNQNVANAIFLDVFTAGGVLPASKSPRSTNIEGDIGREYPDDCKKICNFIIGRSWDFYDTNLMFENAVGKSITVNTDLHGDGLAGRRIVSQQEIFTALAMMCAKNKIYWNDVTSSKSVIEMETHKKSIFGGLLWEYKCFLSQQGEVIRKRSAKTSSASTTTFKYKDSGGHSADIPNLLSAGKVIKSEHVHMLCIEADKIGKNTPTAFITPIKVGAAGIITVDKPTAEKVKFGSGNGYTDCQLWFDDRDEAEAFLEAVKPIAAKYANVRLKRAKVDTNGYFEVSTEFGNAFIKAHKLNEALKEAMCESDKREKEEKKQSGIQNIDVYEEAFSRYEY